ncbi:MAG: hypothetical protein MJ002_06750 [Paludibacteraceae bacterium]|nr:hypothetical protein [Paludibacteraceae bacterium]
MTKRIATNWINTPNCQYHNAVVEIRDGVVTSITPLADFKAEPAHTTFINGTLSAPDNGPIYVGYSGKLLIKKQNNITIWL